MLGMSDNPPNAFKSVFGQKHHSKSPLERFFEFLANKLRMIIFVLLFILIALITVSQFGVDVSDLLIHATESLHRLFDNE